jgi:hypothetical protein
MKSFQNWRFRRLALVIAFIVGGEVLAMLGFLVVMNADFYGRLIQTGTARGVGDPRSSEVPVARLVLHRLLPDEDAVEASLQLFADSGEVADAIRAGKTRVTAVVRDGSSYQPFGIRHEVTLDASTAKTEAGALSVGVESERFTLPVLPSVSGYPFDALQIHPFISVAQNGMSTDRFRLEIQKAIPGRLMQLSDDKGVEIRLTRSPSEKAIVVTGSVVFLLLSGLLVFSLFHSERGLTTLEELVAVGGYLLAAAGFREILGVSRAAGTSALEVAVIGVPLLALTVGVAFSFVRGRHQLRDAPQDRTQ